MVLKWSGLGLQVSEKVAIFNAIIITISLINAIIIIVVVVIVIIITRPKPAYGRQGLAGSWGQDTNQARIFWGILNVSLRASGAQLRYKLSWNHKNQPEIMKKP